VDNFPRNGIRIERRNTHCLESSPHVTLARGDAARQCNPADAAGVSHRLWCQTHYAGSSVIAASFAGAIRSSTNVFHSWHCGHCQSSSVLR